MSDPFNPLPVPPGPPFDEPQAPYQPFPVVPAGAINGTPSNPNFASEKQFYGAGYPVHMSKSSGLLSRSEPILTPQMLISRHLMGIPLTFPNGDGYTVDNMKDQINLAMNEIETLCRITVSREQFSDKVPYDAALFKTTIHLRTEQGPVLSVNAVNVVSSDGYRVFSIPSEWIESSGFAKGFVNVIPIMGSYSVAGGGLTSAYGGLPYFSIFNFIGFMPGFWQIDYTTGVSKIEGQVPTVINELCGTIAAINVLSAVQTMFLSNSQSLSRDGVSQSSSGPSTRTYAPRIEDLEKKREVLLGKVKAAFSSKFLISQI